MEAIFYQACSTGDLNTVKQYVESPQCIPIMLRHGLVKAVENSQPAITSYLLARDAEIDEAVTMKAAEGQCLQIFESLYEHGWEANEPTLFGSNILTLVYPITSRFSTVVQTPF